MAHFHSPRIVTDGLVLALDAANTKSYPGSGTTWFDRSGNGNNGTLVNGPTFSSGNGGSISFDGINDQGSLPTLSSTSNGFSISLWINSGRWALPECPCANTSGIVDWSTDYWNYAAIVANTGGPYFVIYNQSASPTGATVGFGVSTINTWFHLTATFGPSPGGTLRTYTNGVFYGSNGLPGLGGEFTVTAAPSICAYNRHCGNCYLDANVSQVQIYNRALTASEVLQNYNATKGRFGL
jgi:hypothetical protein